MRTKIDRQQAKFEKAERAKLVREKVLEKQKYGVSSTNENINVQDIINTIRKAQHALPNFKKVARKYTFAEARK